MMMRLKYIVFLILLVMLHFLGKYYFIFSNICDRPSTVVKKHIDPVKILLVGGNSFRKDVFDVEFNASSCLKYTSCRIKPGKLSENADMYMWEAAYLNSGIENFKIPESVKNKLTGLIDGEPRFESESISKGRAKFNFTIDYRVNADIRWLYARTIIDNGSIFNKPIPTSLKRNEIAFVNSNCRTKSKREQYVKELMNLGIVQVKSYGRCLKNSKWPSDNEPSFKLDPLNEKLAGKYKTFAFSKFCIAMENSVIKEYNSEKLWHAFAWGCVPIYLGDVEIEKYLPTKKENMYLDIRDFDYNMTKLSERVKFLMDNDDEYNKLLEWKNKIPDNSNWYEWKKLNSKDVRCEICKHAFNSLKRDF